MQRVLAGRKDPMHLYYYLLPKLSVCEAYEISIDFFDDHIDNFIVLILCY